VELAFYGVVDQGLEASSVCPSATSTSPCHDPEQRLAVDDEPGHAADRRAIPIE